VRRAGNDGELGVGNASVEGEGVLEGDDVAVAAKIECEDPEASGQRIDVGVEEARIGHTAVQQHERFAVA
jgi:hypothetical protein